MVCFSSIRCMKYPATKLALIVAIVSAKKIASIDDTFKYETNTVNDTAWRLGSTKLQLRPDGRR